MATPGALPGAPTGWRLPRTSGRWLAGDRKATVEPMNVPARKPQAPDIGSLVTTAEVAAMLHVHANTVKRLGDRGDLPFFRVCSRGDRRYRMVDVEAMLQLSRDVA